MSPPKKTHISFSEYRLWNACNFKWMLTKKLGYSEPANEFLAFGTAIHSSIEEIILKKHSTVLYEGVFKKHLEAESNPAMLTTYFGKKMSSQGTAILKELKFFDRFKDYEVVGVEKEIYEPLYETEGEQTIYFKGVVDLILKKKDTDEYIIADYKTALKPWDMNKKKEDKTFFCQLALYKHFFSKINGIPLEKIETKFIVLTRDPASVETVEVDFTDEFMKFTLDDITRTIKEILMYNPGIITKAKSKSETKGACQYCFFNKNGVCNSDETQVVEEYVKPIVNNE